MKKNNFYQNQLPNNEAFPVPCSVTPTGDILLRNDGFNAEAAYTLDNFYAHMANILGNMERMEVEGAVLQVGQDANGNNSINMLLLYDKRKLLGTMGFMDKLGRIHTSNVPGEAPGILHTNPEGWSFEGALPNGTKVTFRPVYDIPLNYTADTQEPLDAESKNIGDPSIVVAYGKRGIVDYALDHYANPQSPQQTNPIPNETVADAIELVTREVTSKIAQLKRLK